MYGSAESVVGDLARERELRQRLFLATKISTRGAAVGIAQMQDSLHRPGSERIALMQVHPLAKSPAITDGDLVVPESGAPSSH